MRVVVQATYDDDNRVVEFQVFEADHHGPDDKGVDGLLALRRWKQAAVGEGRERQVVQAGTAAADAGLEVGAAGSDVMDLVVEGQWDGHGRQDGLALALDSLVGRRAVEHPLGGLVPGNVTVG